MFMAERVFVDTNVLLYAHDRDAGERHAIAEHVLRQLWKTKTGVVSTQVLQELYVQLTKRADTPAGRRRARELVETYGVWPVTGLDVADILAAADYADRSQITLWDASILI